MKPELSNRRIKSALELTIDWFYERIHDDKLSLSPDDNFEKELLKRLSKRKYGKHMARTFFRTVYWELCDEEQLKVDIGPNKDYRLRSMDDEERKNFVKRVFKNYERYIRANYGK